MRGAGEDRSVLPGASWIGESGAPPPSRAWPRGGSSTDAIAVALMVVETDVIGRAVRRSAGLLEFRLTPLGAFPSTLPLPPPTTPTLPPGRVPSAHLAPSTLGGSTAAAGPLETVDDADAGRPFPAEGPDGVGAAEYGLWRDDDEADEVRGCCGGGGCACRLLLLLLLLLVPEVEPWRGAVEQGAARCGCCFCCLAATVSFARPTLAPVAESCGGVFLSRSLRPRRGRVEAAVVDAVVDAGMLGAAQTDRGVDEPKPTPEAPAPSGEGRRGAVGWSGGIMLHG